MHLAHFGAAFAKATAGEPARLHLAHLCAEAPEARRRMSTFFAMGGYAAYVWPAYGVAAVVLIGLLIASVRGLRAREAEIEAAEAGRPRRSRR